MTDWHHVLHEEKNKPYFQHIIAEVHRQRQAGKTIYPPASDVFNAFKMTPLDTIKAVIIGQDPYHGPRQAHGLCFSVAHGVTPPPSLRNIFKALQHDLNITPPPHGCLSEWASQGVLLLNTVLTVEEGKAHSHRDLGWEKFTDTVIQMIEQHTHHPVVYLLWGSHAIKKRAFVQQEKRLVLTAPHPSPLSAHRGFITCRHFSQANTWLLDQGSQPITWTFAHNHEETHPSTKIPERIVL